MLNPAIAQAVIDQGLSLGADFVDIFVENQKVTEVELLSSKIEKLNTGIDFGIGLRMVVGTNVLYGYTNHSEKEELLRVIELLGAQIPESKSKSGASLSLVKTVERHPVTLPLSDGTHMDSKVAYLRAMDAAARAEHEKITQFVGRILQREQQVEIFNSEGLHAQDVRHYSRIAATAVAEDGGTQSSGYEAPGALTGWEFNTTHDPKQLAQNAARQAMVKLYAADCPSGEMPVVIGNGFGGVIFHEACGHLLETTSVEKKASVFHDKMGEMIASPVVSAVDDGLLENTWGSINIDDEGLPTQRTQLIKDGKLTSFMVDRVGAMKTGYAPTGSGRRQSYKFAPASRMRNTFIEAGNDSLEDMIASVDHGIFAKKMGGGSVQPGTGEFNFSVQEGYLIENGKIAGPLKSATLISTGPKVLKEISMVGTDLELAAGMCGSVSGAVPTSVGQPALKVDRIVVGGQS
ncbi:MAG: TldD/PmbA family protein [Bradymonadia bacterium]